MATIYHAFTGDMDDLESFLLTNQDILDRCVFDVGWRWIWNGKGYDQTYVSTYDIDLYDSPITWDYLIEKNKIFFERYAVQKHVGEWISELFHAISDIVRKHDLEFGSSMSVEKGCFALHKYMNKSNVIKLAGLINTILGYKTRIEYVSKGDYIIYIHSDQSVLDNLEIKEIVPEKKPKTRKNKAELLSEEQRLLKELEEVRKKLNKNVIHTKTI